MEGKDINYRMRITQAYVRMTADNCGNKQSPSLLMSGETIGAQPITVWPHSTRRLVGDATRAVCTWSDDDPTERSTVQHQLRSNGKPSYGTSFEVSSGNHTE